MFHWQPHQAQLLHIQVKFLLHILDIQAHTSKLQFLYRPSLIFDKFLPHRADKVANIHMSQFLVRLLSRYCKLVPQLLHTRVIDPILTLRRSIVLYKSLQDRQSPLLKLFLWSKCPSHHLLLLLNLSTIPSSFHQS